MDINILKIFYLKKLFAKLYYKIKFIIITY